MLRYRKDRHSKNICIDKIENCMTLKHRKDQDYLWGRAMLWLLEFTETQPTLEH